MDADRSRAAWLRARITHLDPRLVEVGVRVAVLGALWLLLIAAATVAANVHA